MAHLVFATVVVEGRSEGGSRLCIEASRDESPLAPRVLTSDEVGHDKAIDNTCMVQITRTDNRLQI